MDREALVAAIEPYSIPGCAVSSDQAPSAASIWESILKIVQDDEKKYFSVLPFLTDYSEKNSDFRATNPGEVTGLIADFEKVDQTKERLTQLAGILYAILPFLTFENIKKVLFITLDILNKLVLESNDLPDEFVGYMSAAPTMLLKSDVLEFAFNLYKENVNTDKCCGVSILISFLAMDIIEDIDESGSFFLEKIMEFLKGDRIKQIIALHLMNSISYYLSRDDTDLPEDLFTTLLPMFIHEDKTIFLRSHKTMNRLITLGVFSERPQVIEIIKQYSKYGIDRIKYFFKFIAKYLDDYESVPLNIIQPMFDFLGVTATKAAPLTKAYCLETYTLLAAANKDVLEDVFETELEVCKELIVNNDTIILSKIACFVLALSKIVPETFPLILTDFLPQLANHLLTDIAKQNRKPSLELAQSVAACIEGGSYPAIAAPLVEYTLAALDNANGSEIFYVGSVVLALKTQFTKEQATAMFDKIAHFMSTTTVSSEVNISLHMMKKLMTKQQIDGERCHNEVLKLLEGKISALGGLKPYQTADAKTMLFYFIAAFIRAHPTLSGDISDKILEFVPRTRVTLLPAVLEAVEASIDVGVLKPEQLLKLAEIVERLMHDVQTSDEEEYCSVVEIAILLVKRSTVPAAPLLKRAFLAIGRCHGVGEEEEDVDACEDDNVLPTLTRLVLTIYLCNAGLAVEKDLLSSILEDLPLERGMEDIIPLVVDMIKEPERFKTVLLAACRPLVHILMMPKNDQLMNGMEPEMVALVKAALKETFKKNRLIERTITKEFGNSRPKLNKFNSLFK